MHKLVFASVLICPLAVMIGCSSSDPASSGPPPASGAVNAPSPSSSTVSTGQASDSTTAGPIDYAADIQVLTARIRELVAIHQRPSNADNLQSLGEASTKKLKEIEEIAYRLQGAKTPDESTARQLESGQVPQLNGILKTCNDLVFRPVNSQNPNRLSGGDLMIAKTTAERARKHLLAAITPKEPEVARTETPPASLDSSGGAKAGFAAPSDGSSPEMKTPAGSDTTSGAEPTLIGRWQSMVDPPAASGVLESSSELDIKVPGLRPMSRNGLNGAQLLDANSEQSVAAGIVYPTASGPFVRVGSNVTAGSTSEVWNYATGKKLGSIRGLKLDQSKVFALSSDGAYFAAQPHYEGLIGLWDVKAAKPLGGIAIESWDGLAFAAFGAENRLVIMDNYQLKIFTMPNGKPAHAVEFDIWAGFEKTVLTPGGKYVALPMAIEGEAVIAFYDVLTGEPAAQLKTDDEHNDPDALAVSTSGEQLFVLSSDTADHIAVYDLRTGYLDRYVDVAMPRSDRTELSVKFYDGPQLSAFPDGNRLLLAGEWIIDSTTGHVIKRLPESVAYWVGIVGDNRLAVLNGSKLVGWDVPTAE